MTLRRRLTVGVLVAIVGVAAVLSLFAYRELSHILRNDVDDDLRGQATHTAQQLLSGQIPDDDGGRDRGPRVRTFGRGVLFAQFTDLSGTVIYRSQPMQDIGGVPAPESDDRGRDSFETVRLAGEKMRVLSAATPVGTVQVAQPVESIDRFLVRVRMILIAAIGFAAASALVFSQWVARSTLRPVEAMTRTARNIQETGDLSQRVHPAFEDEEFIEFGTALNEMLDSIETSEQTQRQFVADASHELKTPLTSLRGNAQYVAARNDGDDDVAEASQALVRDIDRLISIADSLTTLARLDATPTLQMIPEDLDQLVADATSRASIAHPDHVYDSVSTAGTQVVESEMVRRILSNLLDNAGQYTPAGTTVRTRVDAGDDGVVRIVVEDDGPGVPEDEMELLFDRFRRGTTSVETKGSGLGLAIVSEAAKRHHGSATLTRSGAGGLCCTVELRREPVEPDQPVNDESDQDDDAASIT